MPQSLEWGMRLGLREEGKQHCLDLQKWDLPLCALGLRSERMRETEVEKWEKKTLRNSFIH